ncbi:hypothetical protein E8E11_001927 [Didymella keratinophila]|nr:hypothetical protein E8E11_001927 [Didymella keratinophila]
MVNVRAPTQPPLSTQHRQLQILFRQPGYDDGNNVLFKLQAPDTDDDGKPGLYAQLAIDACAIITGDYVGRGWLSLLRDDNAPIDPTSTLHERSYYFHLDAAEEPYPIVPNFLGFRGKPCLIEHDPSAFESDNRGTMATLDDTANALLLQKSEQSGRLTGRWEASGEEQLRFICSPPDSYHLKS